MTSSHIPQIFLRIAIQNQIGIAQWVIVDEVIQFWPLRHGHVQFILNSGAVDGDHSPIPEQQFHAPGVHEDDYKVSDTQPSGRSRSLSGQGPSILLAQDRSAA